jgi:hypothetical protein
MPARAAVVLVLLAAVVAIAFPGHAAAARTPVVPSLEPAATAKLWKQLVDQRPRRLDATRQAACRPLRAVFYAQTDWLRLATRLAAQASPCAQYYISVPPLAASKTTLRNGEAAKIRALGPNFHALAEINWAGWQRWVAQNSSTWFDAGVEARRRMAAAGFDVSEGDTWAVNEFPSSVRVGSGSDRQNARDLVRGLFTGDGGPDTKGTVFVVGVGQSVLDTTLYQTNLQNWFGDSGFWADMTAYVADWSQEVYGDYRRVGVAGAPPQLRRDQLNDYLQHQVYLARVAPPAIEPGRTFIQTSSSPLANAAWSWASSYGYTAIPFDQMESFVSEQVYALRSFSAVSGQPQDHWGFAWAPRNPGLPNADYVNQSRAILDRLAAAIRDSGQQTNSADPGIEACTATCNAVVPGASFTQVWKSFRTWTQPVLTFSSAPQTLAAGAPSGPIALTLLNATGSVQPAQSPITITLRSGSPRGQFSLAPTGPWTPTLVLSIPAGGSAAAPFYYLDTRAGSSTVTASASGVTSGTQPETILPGAPVSMRVATGVRTVAAGASTPLSALGTDQYGNPVPVAASWAVAPAGLGTIQPLAGSTVNFTAGPKGGRGTVTATGAGFTASAPITVAAGVLRVAGIRYGIGAGKTLLVTVSLVDTRGRPVPNTYVSVLVRRRGYPFATGRGTTLGNGRKTFRVRHKPGCYRTTVVRANANGYRWDGKTPVNRFCR